MQQQLGDFFGAATKILTVAELTRSIRSLLEARIGSVWVQGEISNYRSHPSGHQYFTLKDQNGNDVTLSTLRGKPVVIVFYPFTFTGVCLLPSGAGIAVGEQAAAVTVDHGATWIAGTPPPGLEPGYFDPAYVNGVACDEGSRVVAVGYWAGLVSESHEQSCLQLFLVLKELVSAIERFFVGKL